MTAWWPTAAEWETIRLSLRVAAGATALSLLPGIACAWLLSRTEFRGKAFVDGLLHAPLVLPPVVTGYLLLLTFGRHGWVGRWLDATLGISLAFTWKAAALASAVMAFPLLVRSIRLAMDLVDPRLEQAAGTLGAGPWRTFRTITLPLSAPGILGGLVLGFARGLGEFGATMVFAGNIPGETRTLPLALYTQLQTPGGEVAAWRLVGMALVIAVAALACSEHLQRRADRFRMRRPHA